MDWHTVALEESSTLGNALLLLDRSHLQIVLVTNKQEELLGTLTDGDVRRALLKGASLDDEVSRFINPKPVVVEVGAAAGEILGLMRRSSVKSVPVVDAQRRVVDLKFLEDFLSPKTRDTPVLIMAGGRGERLKPLTDSIPKPLLTIGSRSLIETLLSRISNQGFHNIWIAVHYRADDIIDLLGDGSQFGLKIQYLKEESPLGTAGALRLLPSFESSTPILVCNADLLNGADFGAIMDHHISSEATATLTVTQHFTEIPFGVAQMEHGKLVGLEEKPVRKDLISAGINVFNSSIIDLFAFEGKLDIPDVYSELLRRKEPVVIYEIEGYWLDVGTFSALKQAQKDHGSSE